MAKCELSFDPPFFFLFFYFVRASIINSFKVFTKSVCGDELFLQTVARNSKYAEKICNPNTMPDIADTRLIDWERGSNNNPYVFRESDYEELMKSKALFARKFDLNIDKKIVEKL